MYGRATDNSLDADDQIIDEKFAAEGLAKWLATGGNIRVQHSPALYPAGIGLEVTDDGSAQWLKGAVVEPTAKLLVEKGVLTSFSVGIARPKIVRDTIAKNGRVVGGEFVEVSLVDRPANASCKFDLVKGNVFNGEWDPEYAQGLVATLTKAEGGDEDEEKCDLCKGTGKILEGHRKCPDCGGSGLAKDVKEEKARRLTDNQASENDPDGDGDDDSSPETDSDHDYWNEDGTPTARGVAAGFSKKSVGKPVGLTDEIKSKFVSDIKNENAQDLGSAIHRLAQWGGSGNLPTGLSHADAKWLYDQIAAELKDRDPSSTAGGNFPAPGSSKGVVVPGINKCKALIDALKAAASDSQGNDTRKVVDAPYAVKRAHDVFCPAYSVEDVEEHYSVTAKGGYLAFADTLPEVLYSLMQQEFDADAVTVKATKVADLAQAYSAVAELRRVATEDGLVEQVRSDLHRGFMVANEGLGEGGNTFGAPVKAMPSLDSEINPGRFKRPLITSGQSQATASRGSAALDVPSQSHVPTAGQFDRQTVPGEEQPSPGNTSGPTGGHAGGRTFYTNAARDATTSALQALHDHIASTFPSICPLAPSTTSKVAGELPGQHDSAVPARVSPSSFPGAVGSAPGEKSVEADLVKVAIAEAVKTQTKVYEDKIAELQATIDQLGAQPDPAQAPIRGAAWTSTKPIEKTSAVDEDPRLPDAIEKVNYLRRLVRSGDPTLRLMAEGQLEKAESELTKLLTK